VLLALTVAGLLVVLLLLYWVSRLL